MIIPKMKSFQPDELKQVETIAADSDCSILEIQGRNRCVYAILEMKRRSYVQADCGGYPISGKLIV